MDTLPFIAVVRLKLCRCPNYRNFTHDIPEPRVAEFRHPFSRSVHFRLMFGAEHIQISPPLVFLPPAKLKLQVFLFSCVLALARLLFGRAADRFAAVSAATGCMWRDGTAYKRVS